MKDKILDKNLETWLRDYPLLENLIKVEEVFWQNTRKIDFNKKDDWPISLDEIREAEDRLNRFAPFLMEEFKELKEKEGIIESPLTKIEKMQKALGLSSSLYLKQDNLLPVAGSIKARGGIYEVLKHTEKLAKDAGILKSDDDYRKLSSYKDFFKDYTIQVGSTGNLGLSIGIISAKIGYRVIVHMSNDAAQWKKDLLREKGVEVVEYSSDYSKAVAEGRRLSDLDPRSYFIDDERSLDLFLGYTVAGLRLEKQLKELNITVDRDNPLYIYLPCGVGGGPGGIAYSLKFIFKDAVRLFFAEPTHSPAMILSIYTDTGDKLSVGDFNIDNKTIADGLAVGRASEFVSRQMRFMLDGLFTVKDVRLYTYLQELYEKEGIYLEPSACAGFLGTSLIEKNNYFNDDLSKVTHIVWATGGSLVPDNIRKLHLSK